MKTPNISVWLNSVCQKIKAPQAKQTKNVLAPTTNPYINARREWNERYGDYIAQAAAWRLTALLAIGVSLIAMMGLIYMGSQNHLVPYVVEVDKLGAAMAVGPADKAGTPDSRIIRAGLANWISAVRSVYTDASAERGFIDNAYAMTNKNGAAYKALNDYFSANDPFKRAQSQTVNVTIESVLFLSGNTWRVEWQEETHDISGQRIKSQDWQATLTIVTAPPTDESVLFANPAGIYVNDFHWSPRL